MSANSPNPLVPQGSLQQQAGTAKSKVRVAVFSIIAVHAVLFVGVLMQGGCKKDEPKAPEIALDQPPVNTDTYHTNPADLASSPAAPGTSTPGGPAPVTDQFGGPAPAPVTPTGVAPTSSLPPTAPVVDMGLPPVGGTPGVPTVGEPAPAVQQYTIAKGDNFYTIAKKLKTTTKKIIDANPNVDPAKLQLGQKINVPVSSTAALTAGAEASVGGAPAPASSSTTITHEVKSGDTLYGIAKKYGTTAKAIKSANNLKTDRINVGQKLKVSAKATAAAPAPEPVITAPASLTPIPVVPGTN
jgi:LysM repeat protein